ncbi:MAG: type II toxin-antitoxin system VapC family toxin [Bacteroidales bacterium]|nr:type II toxin-antitoxin system VapC family toxin [Bacteroidales bacterium]
MRILFDTHALIWFLTDSPRLSDKVRAKLLAPDAELFFSSVSILEIAIKHSLKPELMPCSPEEVRRDSVASGIRELPFISSHSQKVGELPWLHRDPFDRMLVAQAMTEEVVLLSHDEQVRRYGDCVIGF